MRYLVTNIVWLGHPGPSRKIVEVDCPDEIPAHLGDGRVLSCQWEPLLDVDPITRRELLQQAIAKAGSSTTKLAEILVRDPRQVRRMVAGDAHISDAVLIKCQEVINNGS